MKKEKPIKRLTEKEYFQLEMQQEHVDRVGLEMDLAKKNIEILEQGIIIYDLKERLAKESIASERKVIATKALRIATLKNGKKEFKKQVEERLKKENIPITDDNWGYHPDTLDIVETKKGGK